MAGFVVNVADVPGEASDFPSGVVEGRILAAEMDISSKTHLPMIVLQLEIFHPEYGTATLKDWITSGETNFERRKVKSIWTALNDYTPEELEANPEADLDPQQMIGAEILVQIGDGKPTDDGRVFKNVVSPFYYPLHRASDLLEYAQANLPI